jgi:hypothetical protein
VAALRDPGRCNPTPFAVNRTIGYNFHAFPAHFQTFQNQKAQPKNWPVRLSLEKNRMIFSLWPIVLPIFAAALFGALAGALIGALVRGPKDRRRLRIVVGAFGGFMGAMIGLGIGFGFFGSSEPAIGVTAVLALLGAGGGVLIGRFA